MKKIIILMLLLSVNLFGQRLMIPRENLFSPKSNKLQPLCLLIVPGTPTVSFCPGFTGVFGKLPPKLQNDGKYGMIVTAILVDKENKKIEDTISCAWKSLDSSVLKVIDIDKKQKVKRAYILIPQKSGTVGLEINMGKEKTKLALKISKDESIFKFQVLAPDKTKKSKINKSEPKDSLNPPLPGK